MNTDSGTKTIKIDLDFSDNNRDIAVSDLVQKQCFESLEKQVQADLTGTAKAWPNKRGSINVSDEGQEKYPPGSGLVYFIDGTRGAGKSTFLRTAYQTALAPNKKTTDVNTKCLAKLAYIDPSRIENNEIILLSVLKALKEKVECKSGSQGDESKRKDFRSTFKKLAGGLSLFADGHHQLKQLDPELLLDLGLDQAGHSIDLRKHLHALFDLACQMLNVDALLLAFDDADTNAKHAHKVLECIRCYLDTPRLVILVTGDMELYSLLVRDHFYTDLGHSKHDQGTERTAQRVRMVDHLEDQYLLKLFPIRRRLQLRPLWNLLNKPATVNGIEIKYVLTCSAWGQDKNKRDPTKVLTELVRRGLRIKVDSDIKLYLEFLLKQPLRSVLQVLSRCAPYLSADDSTGDLCKEWHDDLSESLRESLRAMALGSLYKFNIDVDAIAAHELPALIEAVFELANRDGDPDTAAYLRPQPSEADLKNCFVSLSSDVAGLCAQNPAALLQYMLAGPGSVSIFGEVIRRKNKEIAKETLKIQFKQHMGIGRKEDSLNWARHATATIAAPHGTNPTRSLVDFGVIGLNKSKPDAANENNAPGYKTISQAIEECNNLPIFALSLLDVSGTSTRSYASIFNILGLIGRLLQNRDFSTAYPPLSISRPEWDGGGQILTDDTDEYIGIAPNAKHPTISKPLNDQFISWSKKSEIIAYKVTPSSVLLGKIWTRLYFSLEKVSDKQRGNMGPASLMQMFALCVINSFFIEEVDHHLSEDEKYADATDRTNPLTSADLFIRKFEIISTQRDKLPLTYMIATCPLILGLIENKNKTHNHVASLLAPLGDENSIEAKQITNRILCQKLDWDRIEKTYVAGRWKKEQTKQGLNTSTSNSTDVTTE